MARLRYNGLTTTLGADLLAADTSITFASALTHAGGAVPTIGGGDTLTLSLLDADGAVVEIVSLTDYTSGATTGTIARAQESTTATDHASGAPAVHAATAADFAAPASAGGSWATHLSLPLTSVTGWTSTSGTWGITSGQIKQTSTSVSRLHYGTKTPSVQAIYDVEILPDTAIGSGDRNAGLRLGDGTATAGAALARINWNTSGNLATGELLREGVGSNQTIPASGSATSGWHKIRLVLGGVSADMWMMPSGTSAWQFVGGVRGDHLTPDQVTLVTEGGGASFRNLTVYIITQPY